MYTYKNSERLGEVQKKNRYCNYKILKCNFLKITKKQDVLLNSKMKMTNAFVESRMIYYFYYL